MEEKKMIYVIDTNVCVYDPECINVLTQGGNLVLVPLVVIYELDQLKNKPEKGMDAREAIRRIEEAYNNGLLDIAGHPPSKHFENLDKKNPDHNIIATGRMAKSDKKSFETKRECKFDGVVLISRDRAVRIVGKKLKLEVEDYRRNRVEIPAYLPPKEINVEEDVLKRVSTRTCFGNGLVSYEFPFDQAEHPDLIENEGVVCFSNTALNGWGKSFAAIRKGDIFKTIPPEISAYWLTPLSIEGNGPNWRQIIALAQLLDPEVKLVFLQGGAGTGKTLLAVASALETRKSYRRIVITRPMVHLEDEDRMGFIPGDIEQKIAPWKKPILQAFYFLRDLEIKHSGKANNQNKRGKKNKGKNSHDNGGEEEEKIETLIDRMLGNGKITFEPLDYIRGMTYFRDYVIIDDSQNLTPHQVKTIITRAGEDTKMVFTGDLGQIDRTRRIDRKSSGFAYAINKMLNHPLVGIASFNETLRSPLASLGEERL